MNNYSTPADSDYRVQSLRNDVVNAHLQLAHATKQYSDAILRFMDGMNTQSHDNMYKILQSFPLPTFSAPDNFLQNTSNGSIPVPFNSGHQQAHQQPQQHNAGPSVPPLTQAQVSGDKPNPYFTTVTPYQPKKQAAASKPPPPAAAPSLKRKVTTDDDDDAEEEKKAKKAKKAAKDPNAPKRPASAYLLYQNAVRDAVKKEAGNEGLSHKDLTKKIGEKWQELSIEARQPYADAAKQAMDIWNREKERYKVDHPDGGEAVAAPAPKKRGRKSNAERAQMQADADEAARRAATASAQAPENVPGSGSINPAATFNSAPKAAVAPPADDSDDSDDSSDDDDIPAAPVAAQQKRANDSSDTDDSDSSSDDDDAARRVVAPTPAKSKASQQPASIAPSLTQKQQPATAAVAPGKKAKKAKKAAAE